MSDEARPGNRAVETGEYLARVGFARDPGYPSESESDSEADSEAGETSSYSAGSVRFSSETPEFPAAPGFSDGFEPFEPEDAVGPEAAADPDVRAPAGAAAEAADGAEAEDGAGAEDGAEAEDGGEAGAFAGPDYRARPEFADVFARPALFGRSARPAEPEAPDEPGPEPVAGPGQADEPGEAARPGFSDFFNRPEYRPGPGFTGPPRPSFHPRPEVPEEPEPPAAPAVAEPTFYPVSQAPAPPAPHAVTSEAGRHEAAPPEAVAEAPATHTTTSAETGRADEPAGPAGEPSVTVEVPGRPTAQHPVRTTGELSVLRMPEPPAGIDTRLPEGLWAYDNYPEPEHVPPGDGQAGIVSLGYIGNAIKRTKKIWCATTLLGVIVAGGLYATYHPKYTDTTTVLLALDPSLDPNTAIQTDAILADDSTVAQLSMHKLGLRETLPAFMKSYTVAVATTSNNLLTFTASGPTSNAAYNEANTLANTFLQYRAQTELEKESANTSGQSQQVTQTQQTIKSIDSQISKLQSEGVSTQDSRMIRLQGERTSAENLLTALQQTVATDEATQRSTTAGLIAGSSVIDTGVPAIAQSQKKFALEYGGAAIFGGLVLGLLFVAISAVVSDRLRRRDDVAAALGAPVQVSVASGGGKRTRDDGQDLKRVAAYLGGAVPGGSDGAGSLVIVAVDDTRFVSEAIREMAVTAAREGKRVVVADLADGALGELFGEQEPGSIRPVDVGGVRTVIVTPERGDPAPVGPLHAPSLGTPVNGIGNVHAAADLFITLATVSPATGAAHLRTWADDAVAVVTAGKSSVTKVQAVGEMLRFAGVRLNAAILLGADEKDESLGFVTV